MMPIKLNDKWSEKVKFNKINCMSVCVCETSSVLCKDRKGTQKINKYLIDKIQKKTKHNKTIPLIFFLFCEITWKINNGNDCLKDTGTHTNVRTTFIGYGLLQNILKKFYLFVLYLWKVLEFCFILYPITKIHYFNMKLTQSNILFIYQMSRGIQPIIRSYVRFLDCNTIDKCTINEKRFLH